MDDVVVSQPEARSEPMTSRQKVIGMLAQLDEIEPAGVEPSMQALLLAGTMARGTIVASLPEDPDELDTLLENGARLFLNLRGDDARALTIADA